MKQDNSQIEQEIRSVYQRMVGVMLDFDKLEDLEKTMHPDFIGYGTAKHEFLKTLEDVKNMAQMQKDQLEGQEFRYDRKLVFEKVFAGGNSCLILEEFQLFLPGSNHQLQVRLSTLLEKINGKWLVTHYHGSTPDSDIAEEEAFPEQGLRKKNEELEAKIRERTRELEVEAALERTRTQSLQMQHSSELNEVSKVFHEQLLLLGIDSEFSFVWLPDEAQNTHLFWTTWAEETKEGRNFHSRAIRYPLDKTEPYTAACFTDWESGVSVHEHFVPPGEIEAFFTSWEEMLEGAEWLKAEYFPDGIYYTEAFIKYGCFGIDIRRPLTEEEKSILHRFAIEFERTYSRFLELKKAEAQAREAQIEAALERVRARTMAMQHSDELTEASHLLDKEVRDLGIKTWGCAFNIYREKDAIEWFGNEQGLLPTYTVPREGIFKEYYDLGQKGESLYVKEFSGEECIAHYEYMSTLPIVGDVLRQLKKTNGSFPTYQIDHVVFFKYGYLLFITRESVPESYDIFRRFAKVFEQTYTRFLDLQKAEAQTREAQVEAALERVRSRSMAMHKTEELQDVINTVYQQFLELKVEITGGAFITINSEIESELVCWGAGGTAEYIQKVHLPFMDMPIYTEIVAGIKNGPGFFEESFTLEEKQQFFKELFKIPPYSEATKTHKNEVLSRQGGYTRSCVVSEYTSIFIINHHGRPFTEEENDILKRIGKVFEQTYMRFLDLQKAEAQAREARIEAALEKIRSRTMAMQHSNELPEAANLLFLEIQALGIPAWSCGYNILAADKKSATCWMSSEGAIQEPFILRLWGENSFEEMGAFVRGKNIFFVQELGGEAIEAHYDHMKSFPDLLPIFEHLQAQGLSLPTYQINHLCKFSQGFLLFITYEKVPEAHELFKRFTTVFEQTYTRFLDLKRAEAQARESKIETALERVRARALAMQQPEEIKEVAQVMRREMGLLGVEELETSSIYIHDQETNNTECWYAIKDIREEEKVMVADYFVLDLNETQVGREMLKFYESSEEQVSIVMKGEARKEWIKYCETHSKVLQGYYGEVIPERTYHLHKFSHGAIGVATPASLSEESWSLLKRAASVFSLAYSRFKDLTQARLDLQRLKEEKKRAEDALKELQLTQQQLVHAEKMASLGELTAGIAHEIQNPLNFVNNFSEVSRELLEEMIEELKNGDQEEVDAITQDLIQNLEKINHHGKRADSIVKGMLQHSRTGDGKNELTDLNVLSDEYMRLAYHGLRAKDKSFNATMETDMDDSVGKVNIVPQDIGRVLLNLLTNAFHAVSEKKEQAEQGYQPRVTVRTRKVGKGVEIQVMDNGNGIPEKIKGKIFQPFFTTKPTGQGTGLGLSMSYDIVTKGHGGKIEVTSKKGEGTTFTVTLPGSKNQ